MGLRMHSIRRMGGWVNKDVLGIDLGITLLSAENLRTGNVWKWFGRNRQVRRALV